MEGNSGVWGVRVAFGNFTHTRSRMNPSNMDQWVCGALCNSNCSTTTVIGKKVTSYVKERQLMWGRQWVCDPQYLHVWHKGRCAPAAHTPTPRNTNSKVAKGLFTSRDSGLDYSLPQSLLHNSPSPVFQVSSLARQRTSNSPSPSNQVSLRY